MYSTAIDWIADRILHALADGEAVGPDALRLILHVFASTGREDLRAALGPALGGPLLTPDAATLGPDHLLLLAEAVEVADDCALRDDVAQLADSCRRAWPSRGPVARAVAEVEACLTAGAVLSAQPIVAAAVDELERVIASAYEPGEGVARTTSTRSRTPGDLRDQVVAASALLRAYTVTARLPYAMLAEELMKYAVRGWWNELEGTFANVPETAGVAASDGPDSCNRRGFATNCHAARVLGHLAALHADPDYRTVAVVGQQVDYADRAGRTLSRLHNVYQQFGVDSAPYGLAIEEWLKRT